MPHSLLSKLTLAFLLVAMLTAGLVAVFIRLTSVERLSTLIIEQQSSKLKTYLLDYYQERGSWEGLAEEWSNIRRSIMPPPPTPEGIEEEIKINDKDNHRPQDNPPFLFGFADAQGKVIVPINAKYAINTTISREMWEDGTILLLGDKPIGIILNAPLKPHFYPAEDLFLHRTNEALLYAIFGAMVVALLMGIFLARTLIHPLQALTQAAQNITQGNLEQEVILNSKDEIGQLAQAFNKMSREVARVNRLQRQMTADIAHDLRTPLLVIAGYIEAMKDGVLQPTTQRLSLIYTEIERLQQLVGDLRMLSQADAGELMLHRQYISPKTLLQRVAETFTQTALNQHITLSVNTDVDTADIYIDEARMMQVFGNLISNALRYTPEGGKIKLSVQTQENLVTIMIRDNGIGIPEEDIPNIFDRFYRVDKSRTESEESGLGLAIAKALITAHGASISVESVYGEYTQFNIIFPVVYQGAQS